MKLTILGSGSPEAYARRASSGYLLEVAGQRILFDCGGGVVSRLVEAGFRPSDIDYLFFTHLHSDHMIDYARLIHGLEPGFKQAAHDTAAAVKQDALACDLDQEPGGGAARIGLWRAGTQYVE
ncbi:MAG: MBL fold metallo-hydrolase, partial [Pseudomonadota bacterium]